jgi:hypothetical protein
VSNLELIPSPQKNVVTGNELTYGLEDFSFAPLTPSTIQSDALSEDSMTYLSQDVSILSLPLPLEPLPLDIPPALPIPTSWSPILPSLPASLRTIISHYEYTSSLTLHPSDPAKAAWLTHLPSLAINHSYLLNCVLSVASLHLGRLNAHKRVEMNALAASRMNKALSTYRAELAHVTRDNAAALFASATLTAVYLFRTTSLDMEELRSSIPPGTLTPPADVTEKMLACALRPIWGLRGPLTVLMSGWTWVTNGKMQSVAARKWWPQNIMPATSQAAEEDERLARLGDAWDAEDSEKMDLIQALGFLREAFALVSQLTLPDVYPPMTAIPYSVDDTNVGVLTDRGAIFVWGTRISREFMQRVEARDRDALVVLAHYAVLPGRVRNVWWLEGLGADMVTAIAMTLGKENWGLIEWPASVVGVELDNLFDPRRDRLQGQPEEMGMEVI